MGARGNRVPRAEFSRDDYVHDPEADPEAFIAAREGGERYRRILLRRIGWLCGAAWTLAGLALIGLFIALVRSLSGL